MRNSHRLWIILFAALAVAGAGAFLLLRADGGGSVAYISQNGEELYEIELNAVALPYDIRVDAPDGGYNVIHIEHGSVAVTEADCPDLICVRQGAIEGEGVPIVCLPHGLVIRIGGGS